MIKMKDNFKWGADKVRLSLWKMPLDYRIKIKKKSKPKVKCEIETGEKEDAS